MTVSKNLKKYRKNVTGFQNNLSKEYYKEVCNELENYHNFLIYNYNLKMQPYSGNGLEAFTPLFHFQPRGNRLVLHLAANEIIAPLSASSIHLGEDSASLAEREFFFQSIRSYVNTHQHSNSFMEAYHNAFKRTLLKSHKYFQWR